MVHIVNGHRGGRYGFPSCHAANTFGLAFFVWFLFRKRWLTVFHDGMGVADLLFTCLLGSALSGRSHRQGTIGGIDCRMALIYRLFPEGQRI